MTAHDQLFVSDALASAEPTSLPNCIASIGLRLAAWTKNRADNWEVASLYEQLAALSDAKSTRRGRWRATLAQNVRATCERSPGA
jgi:hypothetical protein